MPGHAGLRKTADPYEVRYEAARAWLTPRMDQAIADVRQVGLEMAAARWADQAAHEGHAVLAGIPGQVVLEEAFRLLLEGRLRAYAATCGPRDFSRFADLCGEISPTLAEIVGMHAEAADGNSPDVADWCRHTAREFVITAQMTPEEARAWWLDEYAR